MVIVEEMTTVFHFSWTIQSAVYAGKH